MSSVAADDELKPAAPPASARGRRNCRVKAGRAGSVPPPELSPGENGPPSPRVEESPVSPTAGRDRLTPERRSWNMSRIKGKNTKPEMLVRRIVTGLGLRYRLHRKDLPGKPDLVFGPRRVVIFVHGCFWHRHPGCKEATMPANNRAFWEAKLNGNAERDARHVEALRALGWESIIVWECETRDIEKLTRRLRDLLPPLTRKE